MKRVLRAFLGSALCLCLASAVATAAPAARGDYTVGDFAVLMAKAMNLAADSAGTAISSLRQAGVQVTNPGGRLTEGDVVALLSQAKVSVTTANPDNPVDEKRAGGIIAAFQSELSRNGGLAQPDDSIFETNPTNPVDDFNNGNGLGGKFKRKKKNSQTGSD